MNWLIVGDDIEGYRPKFWNKKDGWQFLDKAQYFSGIQQAAQVIIADSRLHRCRPIHIKDAERLDGLARMVANAQVIIQIQGGAATVTEKPHWLPVHVHDLDTRGWE